eukprot:COSAG02_NODE_68555_length_237_cov_50.550725_1_plen_55_part_10
MQPVRMHRVPVICWKKKLAHVDQRDADQRSGPVWQLGVCSGDQNTCKRADTKLI